MSMLGGVYCPAFVWWTTEMLSPTCTLYEPLIGEEPPLFVFKKNEADGLMNAPPRVTPN